MHYENNHRRQERAKRISEKISKTALKFDERHTTEKLKFNEFKVTYTQRDPHQNIL